MYPKKAISSLLCKLDILDVARHYFGDDLKQRGRNPYEWIALCPFHKEKTPSFTITTQKQFFHCLGCGEHGNAANLVQKMENLGFPVAVGKMCEIAGFRIASGRTKSKRARQRSRETLRRAKARQHREEQRTREYRNIARAMAKKMKKEYERRHSKKPMPEDFREDDIPF